MNLFLPPPDLAALPFWLCWMLMHVEGMPKPRKVPYYANGKPRHGTQGTEDDRAQLVTYDAAVAAMKAGSYTGVGFALQPDANIVALDFDDCMVGGKIAQHVEDLCSGTYTEHSPSGNGVRAFFRGTLLSRKDIKAERGPFPIEVFGHNGFVTFTGRVTDTCSLFGWESELAYLTPAVQEMYRARGWDLDQTPTSGPDNALMMLEPTLQLSPVEIVEYLNKLSPDMDYHSWVRVGMAVHHETGGTGFDLWHNWSLAGSSYTSEDNCRERWVSFGRYHGGQITTFKSVIKQANEADAKQAFVARDEMRERIETCDNEYLLRMKLCKEIGGDSRLDEIARESLAHALKDKLRGLGTELTIKQARQLVAPPRVERGLKDETREEDAEAADVLNARLLAGLLQSHFMHEHGGVGWRHWDGGAWMPCTMNEQVERAKALGPHIVAAGMTGQGLNSRNAAETLKQSMRAMTAPGIEAALKLASSDPRVRASPDLFVGDPEMLNTKTGLLHLPTGNLLPHHPSQLVTRRCAANYVPEAACPRWLAFLHEISCSDDEWIDFLWRACGYTLSGSVKEEVMFFLLGHGANGKSVVANIFRRILNTYATSVPASFLSPSKRDGESATPSLATLPGVRLALANEVEAGARLSAQTVKVACSTEAIAARHNYGDPFVFLPTHKLWVRGNHKPIITDNDDGIWRRIILIPFDRDFAPHERDYDLEAKLMAEADGILAWMVRGYQEYSRRGLGTRGRIAAASAIYRKESDLLGQWVDEQTIRGASFDVIQQHAYSDYDGWCRQQGLRPITKKSFTLGLDERGITTGQRGKGSRERTYIGMSLNYGFHPAQGSQEEVQFD